MKQQQTAGYVGISHRVNEWAWDSGESYEQVITGSWRIYYDYNLYITLHTFI